MFNIGIYTRNAYRFRPAVNHRVFTNTIHAIGAKYIVTLATISFITAYELFLASSADQYVFINYVHIFLRYSQS
jgi:hypothetical protein